MTEGLDYRSTCLSLKLPGSSEFLANMVDSSPLRNVCFQEGKPKGQCNEMPALFKIISRGWIDWVGVNVFTLDSIPAR